MRREEISHWEEEGGEGRDSRQEGRSLRYSQGQEEGEEEQSHRMARSLE